MGVEDSSWQTPQKGPKQRRNEYANPCPNCLLTGMTEEASRLSKLTEANVPRPKNAGSLERQRQILRNTSVKLNANLDGFEERCSSKLKKDIDEQNRNTIIAVGFLMLLFRVMF